MSSDVVKPLEKEEASRLPEAVLCRIARGDQKGRPIGTPWGHLPADTLVRILFHD
jgi:hypothetical protein